MSNIIEESWDNVFNTTDCKCYPNCNHIQYHASIYTDRLYGKQDGISFLEVDVYIQEETLFSYRSTLHITFLDLIGRFYIPLHLLSDICFSFGCTVSYGGIAGLILGISVVGGINAIMDRITCCAQPSTRTA